jgi:hypothetical protein
VTGVQGQPYLQINQDIKTGTYVATYGEMVLYNPVASFSIILPTPLGYLNQEIGMKNVTSSVNKLTVIATGGAQIDGSAYEELASARTSRIYKSIGTGYIVIL